MRYLPLDAIDRAQMLARVGAPDIDALFADIPAAKRLAGPLDLPNGLGEIEVERRLARMAGRNVAAGSVPFFLGAGAYRHHVPATVDHLIQRSEFLTSYTPYQPEIAQGTLQVLFEFQSQVAALTGMEVANASMYDGSTACGEATQSALDFKFSLVGGQVDRSGEPRRGRHVAEQGVDVGGADDGEHFGAIGLGEGEIAHFLSPLIPAKAGTQCAGGPRKSATGSALPLQRLPLGSPLSRG